MTREENALCPPKLDVSISVCPLPQMPADCTHGVRTSPAELHIVGLFWGCFQMLERRKQCHIKA